MGDIQAPNRQAPDCVQDVVLDALSIGVIVADRDARVLYANEAARGIVTKPFGALRVRGGRICGTELSEQARLGDLIAHACTPGAPAGAGRDYVLAPARASEAPDLAICVTPIETSPSDGRNTHAMLVIRAIEPECNLEIEARRLFGLTKTEAKFASALAGGLSLDDAARRHDVTRATARTHLRGIFLKIGVCRQSQVAALLRGIHIPVQPHRSHRMDVPTPIGLT